MTVAYTETLFANTYKDDFSDSDNYHRILFNSGKALQARELTQMQTIIQAEIERFGSNIFKEGAAVNPGGGTLNEKYEFIKLNTDTVASGLALPTDSAALVNTTFTGATTGIKARVLEVVPAAGSDPATLYVQYTDLAGNAVTRMAATETVVNGDGVNLVVAAAAEVPTGIGIKLSSGGGDFFVQGHFVYASPQALIINKYSSTYTGTIGFKITQEVVSVADTADLYDNQGATPNVSAPGADRYRIRLTLIDEADLVSGDNFVYFVKIINSKIVDQAKGTDFYNKVNDIMALRTKEESGNYIVNPFTLQYDSATSTTVTADISGGLAYVDGYRASIPYPTKLTVDRAQDLDSGSNNVVAADYGNYIISAAALNGQPPVKGIPNVSGMETWNLGADSGTGADLSVLGTARVRHVEPFGSLYKYYLFDIKMRTLTYGAYNDFRDVQSLRRDSANFVNISQVASQAVLYGADNNDLLFPLPNARPENLSDISLEVQRRFNVTNASSGVASLPTLSGETYVNPTSWIVSRDSSGEIITSSFNGAGTTGSAMAVGGNGSKTTVLAKVNKSAGVIRPKVLKEASIVINSNYIDSAGNDSDGNRWLNLAKTDILDVSWIGKDSSTAGNAGDDISSLFTLDNGQRDNFYGVGRVLLNGRSTAPAGDVYINFRHFDHGAGDFFGINSYSGVEYSKIPDHTLADGTTINLRNHLDFRPVHNTIGTAFDSAGTGGIVNELPDVTDLITMDTKYYLGRKDKLVVFPTGKTRNIPELSIIKGQSALKPLLPDTPIGAMNLYNIEMNPFTLNDSDLIMDRLKNRSFTMRDIASIDKKVDQLIEYTSLSLLEQGTSNLQVLNENGLARTKAGFLVDNFANQLYSDGLNPDYAAAIDVDKKCIAPEIREDNIRLIYDSAASTNTILKGDNVYLEYDEVEGLAQDTVSETQNINPFGVITNEGNATLSPTSDEWRDTVNSVRTVNLTTTETRGTAPVKVINKQKNNYNFQGGSWGGACEMTGADFGDYSSDPTDGGNGVQVAAGFGNTETRESLKTVIGNRVLNVSLIPFIRSRKVFFKVQGLIPNAKYYPYFDGADVSAWCREEAFARFSATSTDYGTQYSTATTHPEGSSALITDAAGEIAGSFFVPNTPAIRFRTGVRQFQLLDISSYNPTTALSQASARYTAAGVLELTETTVQNTRMITICKHNDPISQTFMVDEPEGMFVTKIATYFKTEDIAIPVQLQLRPVVNGHPSSTEIIPGSIVYKAPSTVTLVTTQTQAGVIAAPTYFEFDEPIFLSPNTEYAIVLMAESTSYETYVSRIGAFELGSTVKRITQQPSLGSLFLSQNGTTWEPDQTKDLCFKIFRADFNVTSGSAILKNAVVPIEQLSTNPFTTTHDISSGSLGTDSATVTVLHPGHGLITNDTTVISGLAAGTQYGNLLGAKLNGTQTITSYDYNSYTFEADSDADAVYAIGGDAISADRNIQFDKVIPTIDKLVPTGTDMSLEGKFTTGQSVGADSDFTLQRRFIVDPLYIPLAFKEEKIFETPRMIANGVKETAASFKSAELRANMTTTSTKVSPVIDLQRASLAMVNHKIDKQASSATTGFNVPLKFVAETSTNGGTSLSKHITTPFTLAETSTGLKILLAANRPSAADFEVYYRVCDEGQILADQKFVLATVETPMPADENPNVFRDYRYLPGGDAGTLNAFSKVQVKIVFRSTNTAKIPKLKDLRIIAMAT